MKNLKHLLFLPVIVLFLFNSTNGQVLNSSFEEWFDNSPSFWATSNFDNYIFASSSEDAHSGSYALKLEAKEVNGALFFGYLNSGSESEGFPVSQKFTTMDLYYKFSKRSEKSYIYISVSMFIGEQGIGLGWVNLYGATNEYVHLSIPITYTIEGIPDNAEILIWVGDYGQDTAADGTYALIDDVNFGSPTTGVDDEINTPGDFSLEQNFPNPFNPSTKIRYTVPSGEKVTLKVYNVLGNEVASLVDEVKTAGSYTADFSASSLSSGTYFYKLQAGNFVETRKMIYLK